MNDNLQHWLQPYTEEYGYPEITEQMIRAILRNPNCRGTVSFIDESSLNLTKRQLTFIEANTCTIIDIDVQEMQYDNQPVFLSRLEAAAINDLLAAVECKQINYKQITNENLILSTARDEINILYSALILYNEIADPFELNMKLPEKDCQERWDNIQIDGPMAGIILDLRHYFSTREHQPAINGNLQYPWRDTGEDMGDFRYSVYRLLQLLWLGVHPFR
jgi:hypothetical protein